MHTAGLQATVAADLFVCEHTWNLHMGKFSGPNPPTDCGNQIHSPNLWQRTIQYIFLLVKMDSGKKRTHTPTCTRVWRICIINFNLILSIGAGVVLWFVCVLARKCERTRISLFLICENDQWTNGRPEIAPHKRPGANISVPFCVAPTLCPQSNLNPNACSTSAQCQTSLLGLRNAAWRWPKQVFSV